MFKNNKGFTLMEIMIAVAILTGMCLLISATMNRSLEAKVKVERKDDDLHALRVALNKMVEDISQSVRAGKNFEGSEGQYVTGFKGGESQLNFTTLGHYHYIDGIKETDQTVIGYELKPADNGFETLFRRETGKLSDKLDEGGVSYPILERVKKFKLTYYDTNKLEWVSEWDSTQLSVIGRLPMAVKIEMTIGEDAPGNGRNAKEWNYMTTALIESYKSALDF